MEKEKKIHGNSKKSKKKQHVYAITDSEISISDKTFKFGISGNKLNKNGTSGRANTQVNSLNKLTKKSKRFNAIIKKKDINGRLKALSEEEQFVINYKKQNNTKFPPPGQKRPNPEV